MKLNRILACGLVVSAAALLAACSSDNNDHKDNTPPAEETDFPFADDEAFLDYLQKTHMNYMWEGAEPNSDRKSVV